MVKKLPSRRVLPKNICDTEEIQYIHARNSWCGTSRVIYICCTLTSWHQKISNEIRIPFRWIDRGKKQKKNFTKVTHIYTIGFLLWREHRKTQRKTTIHCFVLSCCSGSKTSHFGLQNFSMIEGSNPHGLKCDV